MPDRRVPLYQRRRTRPALVLGGVLAVIALVTWTVVLVNSSGSASGQACPTPANGTPAGEILPSNGLNGTEPIAPSGTKVKVLNAGGQRGQANLVAAELGDLGFPEAVPPANDPLFPDENLTCQGQIRFGAAGAGAARTLSLVVPCTELVRDTRTDDSVDLAVGTAFGGVNPSKAARDALDELARPPGATADTGDQSEAAPTPAIDPQVLAGIRDGVC